MKETLMPPIVLTLVCVIVSALLVFAHEQTYVDTTGVMTDQLTAACRDIFGEGDYKMLLEEGEKKKTPITFGVEGVRSIITDGKGKCFIELEEDGYAKNGLHLLIGINSDGAVAGIEFLSIGETPGVGTKVQEGNFISRLIGYSPDTDDASIDGVTAATFSSKGMKAACRKAVELYKNNKGAIFGEG
ncbi:MAG: FMN-binding protein [Ruminococcus sp.]|nr:FMN-binding protein [Ruminococcus sp.]